MAEEPEEIEEMMESAASLMDRVPQGLMEEDLLEVEVPEDMQMPSMENIEIIPEEDGAVVIDFGTNEQYGPPEDFYSNLAENLDDSELAEISNQLLEEYESNKGSRRDWEEAYSKGLELLGFTYEERTEPFAGATGVTHPLLAEAATQFQAQAFNELLPASGPVRTDVMGAVTKEKEDQSQRVRQFMNYYITNIMEEYTPELDQRPCGK